MTMITPSYLGETIEYSSLHACRSTLEDPTWYDNVGVFGLTSVADDLVVCRFEKVPNLLRATVSGHLVTAQNGHQSAPMYKT